MTSDYYSVVPPTEYTMALDQDTTVEISRMASKPFRAVDNDPTIRNRVSDLSD